MKMKNNYNNTNENNIINNGYPYNDNSHNYDKQ